MERGKDMIIGICDDNTQEAETIKSYCEKYIESEYLFYTSGEELIGSETLSSINLLFLDVEMNGLSGIEVKNKLEDIASFVFVVFCTSHTEVMPEAFGYNVVNFISKPITDYAIEITIKKYMHLNKGLYTITMEDGQTVKCDDLIYICSDKKYTEFHVINQSKLLSRKPLTKWAAQLEEYGFFSRSAIINIKYYKKIFKRNVTMQDGTILPVSRKYVSDFKKKVLQYTLQQMRL